MLYQLNYWPVNRRELLARLPMQGVLMTPRAIFLELHTIGRFALILVRCVVATLALGTSESNLCTH